jgi:hypothetical protein
VGQHLHASFACPCDMMGVRGQLSAGLIFSSIVAGYSDAPALSSVCFMHFRCMFHLDVACDSSRCCKSRSNVPYIVMAIHVCCTCLFDLFQNVCCKCLIWILHMLQWLYMYVASVCLNISPVSYLCYECFIGMLHMLQCCICFRHMLQAYVQNVSYLDVCCKECLSGCCSYYTRMLQTYVFKYFTCFVHML